MTARRRASTMRRRVGPVQTPTTFESCLVYEPADWDNVPEPTEADLAEIDAALSAAPPTPPDVPADAWADSYVVKRAIEAVGDPDGSTDWIERFSAHLFGIADAVGERISPADIDVMLDIVHRWRQELSYPTGRSCPKAEALTLLSRMTLDDAAWLVGVTPDRLRGHIWQNVDALRAATTIVMGGEPVNNARKACGVHRETILEFLEANGIDRPTTVSNRGHKVMSPKMRERLTQIVRSTEWSANKIREVISDEFGESLHIQAVRRSIRANRVLVAA